MDSGTLYTAELYAEHPALMLCARQEPPSAHQGLHRTRGASVVVDDVV